MPAFQTLLAGLRRAEKEVEAQLTSIRNAIASLGGGIGAKRGRPKGSKNAPARKRRKMSAAGRARISAAQKKRWAKQKASEK